MARSLRILTTCVLGLSALSLAACSSSGEASTVADDCTPAHTFETVTPGTLTVAADVSLPYVDVDDVTGALGGVDGLVLAKIAEMECLEVSNATIHGSTAIGSVQQKQSDVASGGWYWTEEHGEVLNQTDPVYYDFTALTSKDGQYASLDDLAGKVVGVTQGSLFVEDLQNALGADNVKQYETLPQAMADLKNGRIDAVIAGSGESGYQLSQLGDDSGLALEAMSPDDRLGATLEAGRVVFPSTKGNDELTAAFDEDIATLRENGFVQDALDQYGLTAPENFESN